MMSWWHYLLLVNLYLVLFFGFYRAFLHRETFFQLNRAYLVAGSMLSFIIPLLQSDWIRNLFITQRVHQTIYATVNPQLIYQVKPVESNPITLGQIIAGIYIFGAVILLAKLIYQLLLLKKLINKQDVPAAFSFFKKIHVDKNLPAQQTIIEHEQVHTRQWHSLDVLLIEAVMIVNWFNPVVYLYRKAIKHVHEYIADRKAIETGTSKSEYALLLLSQTFGTVPHQLTNNFFNHSLLKKRIMMLNQNDSKRRALLKYGLSAPLFACMLVLSAATVNNSQIISAINKKTDQAFAINTVQLKNSLIDSTNDIEPLAKPITNASKIPRSNLLTEDKQPAQKPLVQVSIQAHQDSVIQDHSMVFNAVEINPNFPGGEEAFGKFLQQNIHYPEKAIENQTKGRVFVQFVVEKDGSLTEMKTLRDPGDGLGDEAQRVLTASPKWSPGIQNGKAVRVQYTVPVNFTLAYPDINKKSADTARLTIVTKKPAISMTYRLNTSDSPNNKNSKMILNQFTMIRLNGKAMNKADINKLNPEMIESIHVIKRDTGTNISDGLKQSIRNIILIKTKAGKDPAKS